MPAEDTCIISAIAYLLTQFIRIVISPNEIADMVRAAAPNLSFRHPGTECLLET